MKRGVIAILILLLLLPAVITAGSVLFAPVFPFSEYDDARNQALSDSVGTQKSEPLSASDESLPDENRYIVRFSDETSLSEIKRALSGASYRLLAESKSRLFAVVPNDEGFFEKNSEIIDYAEPDLVRGTQAVVNDPVSFTAYESMGVYDAWDIAKGKSDVIVAVLDTGVDRAHEDLAGVSILAGYDAVGRFSGVDTDSAGHGTAVIGLIAATADNGIGVSGIAHGVSILPVKVSSSSTTIYSSDLISGIRFAADAGAKVINMSVGGYSSSYAEQEAVDYAVSKGCILVSASGNGGKLSYADQKSYPASYEGVISVASCNDSGERSDFSQYNDAVDVAAYGESLTVLGMSEGNSVYLTDSGTSYSCAFVSGIAALAAGNVDKGVRFGNEEFLSLIIDTCGNKRSDALGYGVINAFEILKRSNDPIITGVYNGGVYSESVKIGFNRGNALLDGEEISDGETVMTNGSHTLVLTDGDYKRTVSFRLNYNPLVYKYNEFSSHASFEFSRGSAFLNGFPYKSGDKITASGKHIFRLTDGDEYVEKEFTLGYSLPAVYGIEDGMTYNRPVEIKIAGDGSATLDGEDISELAVVIKSGTHILNVVSANGAQSKTYRFTVDFSAAKIYDGDYADATVAVDDENGIIILYGDSLVGIRIYSADSPAKYRHFINTDRVYGHAFEGERLILFGDGGITVLDRNALSEGESSIMKRVFVDEAAIYAYADGRVFGFGNGKVYLVDIDSESVSEVASYDGSVDEVLAYGSEICLVDRSDGKISVFDGTTYKIDELAINDAISDKPMFFGNGYVAIGNKLYYLNNGVLALEFCADTVIAIDGGMLLTDEGIVDVDTGKALGSFAFPVADIATTEKNIYVYGLDGEIAVIDASLEGISRYGAAESVSGFVSGSEEVNYYRDSILCAGNAVSSAVSDTEILIVRAESNLLYRIDKASYSEKTPICFKYIPSEVYCFEGRVVVTFASTDVIYVASESNLEYGTFVMTPSSCESVTVLNGIIYAVSDGVVVRILPEGSGLEISGIAAQYIASDGVNLYVLNGNELSVYNQNLVRQNRIAVNGGRLFAGNAIAVGKTLYNKTTFEKITTLDSEIIALRSDTVVTKNGVYSLRTGEYTGYIGVDADIATIDDTNSLYSFGGTVISVCSFGDGTELTSVPEITGVENGGMYLDRVTVSYGMGIGYLDGEVFESGGVVTESGKHLLHIVLPCGNSINAVFTVESYVSSIEFLVGDRTMSVGETVTLRIKYLPEGASSLPVKFSCSSSGLEFGEMGEVTARAVGKYTVTATVETERGKVSVSCVITVRDDLLTFLPESGITVDRDNGFAVGISAGTDVKTLLSKLYTSKKTAVLNNDGSIEKRYVGTGDRIVMYDADGKTADELKVVVVGDADGDGFISAYDLYVHGRILRGYVYSSEFVKASDLNGNGIIADNDYRMLKNIILGRLDYVVGDPDQNLFGKCSLQTVSYIESQSYIDVAVCISGCKYARGVAGVIEYGEGLEFVEGYSTGWESDYDERDGKISFFSHKEDGNASGRAFNVVFGMRFKVTSEAGSKISITSGGIVASFTDGARSVRFEGIESEVNPERIGELDITVANAYAFKFSHDDYDYDITIPYNSALADLGIVRPDGSTISVEGAVVPDFGKGLVVVGVTDANGRKAFYNINVKRDNEPKFDTNCRLDTLEIEGFRLDPLFDPDITEYKISVPYGTEKINLYCTAQNSSAEIVIGDTNIYGDGTEITVTVGAPDGESLVYTITVSVLPEEPDESDNSTPEPDGGNPVFWIVLIVLILSSVGIAVYVILRERQNRANPDETDNS